MSKLRTVIFALALFAVLAFAAGMGWTD